MDINLGLNNVLHSNCMTNNHVAGRPYKCMQYVEMWDKSHSLQDLKDKLPVFQDKHCHMLRNIFTQCEACLEFGD